MKKFVLTAAVLLAGSAALVAHAQTATETDANFVYGTFVIDQGIFTRIDSDTLSRSNPKHRLCWSVVGSAPIFGNTVAVVETFTSPAGASFSSPQTVTTRSADGRTHELRGSLNSIGQTAVQNCWKFDETDPLGKYSISVNVDGSQLPTFDFVITR